MRAIDKHLVRRVLACLVGAFIYAIGVCIVTRANLGISPISSAPYALSFVVNQTLGICTMWLNVVLIIIQKLVLKKEYTLKTLALQVGISLVFSVFIDLAIFLFGGFAPRAYVGKMLYLLFGCLVLATGMCVIVMAKVVVLPGEGAVNCLVKILRLEFGTAKIIFDSSMVALSITISLLFLEKIEGVREGTLIAAFMIGTFSKLIIRAARPKLEQFLGLVAASPASSRTAAG